jgi:hypothetical protein
MLYKFRERKKEEKCCIRCGMSEKDVRQSGIGCSVWGTDYKKHKYETMSYQLSPLEQYRAKKLEEFCKQFVVEKGGGRDGLGDPIPPYEELKEFDPEKYQAFLSQTIDELWALPDKRNEKENSPLPIPKEFIKLYRKGFNACIAEAERMRDLSIKGKG